MKLSSWNIEGRLSRFANRDHRGSPEQIIREIKRLDSDIIFLPEAFDNTKQIEPDILANIKGHGYELFDASYDETGDRQFAAVVDPHMVFLSRITVKQHQIFRPSNSRNMLAIEVIDPDTSQTIRVLGVHLDDRSEQNRLMQVSDLLTYINSSDLPTIVMGDFNAMHEKSLPARTLRNRAVLGIINYWPHVRTKDILIRLSEMAKGDTLNTIISKSNLSDADSRWRPTTTPKMRGQEWMPSIRMVQIDHIFASPEIKTSNITVAKDGGSDHRAISVDLQL